MPERNAPCPCGSGKKFKKCCGAPGAAGRLRDALPRRDGSKAQTAAALRAQDPSPADSESSESSLPAFPELPSFPGFPERPELYPDEVLTTDKVHAITAELDDFLETLSERHGLLIRRKSTRASEIHGSIRIDISTRRNDGLYMTPAAVEFIRHAPKLGLHPQDLGRAFGWHTGIYWIVGLKPRAKKPVTCLQLDHEGIPLNPDRPVQFTVEEVLRQLLHFEFRIVRD